uniref:scavenger receptor class A member 5-like n=1 Tax=Myxine glutinosa TaxID=7769 RepID=UPI00358F7268
MNWVHLRENEERSELEDSSAFRERRNSFTDGNSESTSTFSSNVGLLPKMSTFNNKCWKIGLSTLSLLCLVSLFISFYLLHAHLKQDRRNNKETLSEKLTSQDLPGHVAGELQTLRAQVTAQSGELEELRASVLRLQKITSRNISLVPQQRPQGTVAPVSAELAALWARVARLDGQVAEQNRRCAELLNSTEKIRGSSLNPATVPVPGLGPPGPKGDTGDRGPAGNDGQRGLPGPMGPSGMKGKLGPRGDMGRPGYAGIQGPMGYRGTDGDPGPRGEKGEKGAAASSMAGSSLIRLAGGPRDNEGRLEVFYNGEWGTVCGTEWDEQDAGVLCHMLGYRYGIPVYGAYYGQGGGKILMAGVKCNGMENSIFKCVFHRWGTHDCNHTDDAGVQCI